MSTTEQLLALKSGKTKRVRGQEVRRDGELFLIDGDSYPIAEAASKLDQAAAPRAGFDYDWTVFLETPPGSPPNPLRHHRCRSKADHLALLEAVKKRKNYLYHGTVIKDGNRYFTRPPYVIDWDSVPEHPEETKKAEAKKVPKKWDGGLSCPFCGVAVNSTPGRTLHVKSQHPDKLDEYKRLLEPAKPVPTKKVDEDQDEDDVVTRQLESSGGLTCPFCGTEVNSTSGRTLHVKSQHPDKMSEYQKLLIGGKL